ncbi:MAG: efflux RND transporter periplasmic adaptor subunit [Candidatus Omnitrophica bacterium]|nr:efflux RND transporter periplasmic adaptor subunit [Candidatus Omnitrophota bacterium]MCB9783109.1 efflux RND transporter periplasmic adaptor subunit [Candidatus Omnitrophota bacterium]
MDSTPDPSAFSDLNPGEIPLNNPRYPLLKKLLIIPPVVAGFAILFLIVSGKKEPERAQAGETAKLVRTLPIPKVDYVPRVLGYGTAQPEKTWEAVAEVSGKIVEIHPNLRRGEILREGTLILRIDPTDYELAIAQENANLADASAELANLQVQEENARRLLQIEKESLKVSERQLERETTLLEQGAIPETQFDQTEKTVLSQRNQVQSLENTLNLVPTQREKINAQIQVIEARLKQAQRDVEQSEIRTPFDCRISNNEVEMGEAVTMGQVLARGDGIDVSEVVAQVPIEKMRAVASIPGRPTKPIGPEVFDAMERLPLQILVRLKSNGFSAEWPARFARVSDAIDPQTRTVGVVAAVDDPYMSATPGVRPPLIKGMYCEVEIRGATRPGTLVIPRSAVHDSTLYLANSENRLERREVEIQTTQADFCVVVSGAGEGEMVVLTDLIPAIDGMLLEPTEDAKALQTLIDQATGKGPVR